MLRNYTLHKERIQKNLEVSKLVLRPKQKHILLGFLARNRSKILLLLVFSFVQVFFELSLLLLGRLGIYSGGITLIRRNTIIPLLLIFFFATLYIWAAYESSKRNQELAISLVIYLRKLWVSLAISGGLTFSSDHKSRILSKIIYHLALLQSSLLRVLSSGPHTLFSVFLLCAFVPNTNPEIAFYLPFFVGFYIFLIFVGYRISKKYVSREQTLASQIIQHIFDSFHNSFFVTNYKNQKEILQKLDDLSSLDILSRVNRNLWMYFPTVLLFAFTTLIFFLGYIYKPSLAYRIFDTPSTIITTGVVVGVLTRILYKSLNFGLALYPLQLALCIGVPQRKSYYLYKKPTFFSRICYQAKKVRIDPSGGYFKRVSLEFCAGDRVLLLLGTSSDCLGISQILSGSSRVFSKPWIVKMDNARFLYKGWIQENPSIIYVNPYLHFDKSLLEAISGSPDYSLNLEDIRRVTALVESTPELGFVLEKSQGLASHTTDFLLDLNAHGILQLASVALKKPSMVIIDSFYANTPKEDFISFLSRIAQDNPDMIMVVPTTSENNLIEYNKLLRLENRSI
ncbi:MAG TPA: hypothetical protein PLT50_00745 [bacterium]|nr:hypothetical protein [bacterium]